MIEIYELNGTAAPSKELGLYVPRGDKMRDANGNVYRVVNAPKRCACKDCAFENKKDPCNVVICKHIVCAWIYRRDKHDVIFKLVTAPRRNAVMRYEP